ncbi:hypothetical protein [Streptomyces spiralis]|uniref:hypothetical protein n=1 Tax=Streptomyces spiralis TaxID=66376 RepID=UPI0036743B6E
MIAADGGFRVVETRVEPPVRKVFPAGEGGEDDDGDPGPSRGVVALDGDEVCGTRPSPAR